MVRVSSPESRQFPHPEDKRFEVHGWADRAAALAILRVDGERRQAEQAEAGVAGPAPEAVGRA